MKRINLPLKDKDIATLKAGEQVLLNGYVYTARDQTHTRLLKDISAKKPAVDLRGQTIYYAGPAPTPPGMAIGSCGPTTSARMDAFTPALLKYGIKAMIGKGKRSAKVKEAIKRYGAVYFLTVGGAGAYLAKRVIQATPLLYKQLGAEAVYRLKIKDFPAIVGIDSKGKGP